MLTAGQVSGSTRNTTDRFSGCALKLSNGSTFTVGGGAPDEPWFLHLDHRSRIAVTLSGFDASMYFRQGRDCTTAALITPSCVDAEGTTETLVKVLDPGDYWLIVDGYAQGTQITSGAYTLNVQITDPCNGISPEGQCSSASQLTWCSVPPAGIDNFSTATLTCASTESCQTVDGLSRCLSKPGGSGCIPGEQRCVNSTTIEACNSQGVFQQQACPGRCVDEAWLAYCDDNAPTQRYSGTFKYQYRTTRLDYTDWDAHTNEAPVPGALVASFKYVNNKNELFATSLTDSEGNFTVDIPNPPGANDSVAVFAASPRLRQGDFKFVVAQPNVGDGQQSSDVTSAAGLWSWSIKPATTPSGTVTVITQAQGSPMLRVFDAVHHAFDNIAARYYRANDGLTLAVWMRPRTSWDCGACVYPAQTSMQLGGQYFDLQLFLNGSEADQEYWADSVTFHELGHWVMLSFGAFPGEAGTHYIGHAYYPGMAWSEGWASWVSAAARDSSFFYDKQDGFVFAYDVGQRKYFADGVAWPRPTPSGGLFQLFYELEITALLWELGNKPEVTDSRLYRALALPRAQQPKRGYTLHTWDVSQNGDPINVQDTGHAVVMMADYLDALVCTHDPANIASLVDSVMQPATYYPYPSQQPICQ